MRANIPIDGSSSPELLSDWQWPRTRGFMVLESRCGEAVEPRPFTEHPVTRLMPR